MPKKLMDKLPPFIGRVGLFVNEGIDTIDTIAKYCNLTMSQIHNEIDEEILDMIDCKTLPVIRDQKS
jgi:N-(5''phosphoribosyl)anthranilate (PRA) isomerase.